ncbi:MAG: response regulator [Devosia sp.]
MNILVVEDEPLIRLGVVSVLEDNGHAVFGAGNADEAIAILIARDDIRLVVTDVDMPGSMDGMQLAALVRSKWPPIKLIVISGKIGVAPSQLPRGAGFLSKPYRDPQLLAMIDDLGRSDEVAS